MEVTKGDLIMAKLKKWPWWPATVLHLFNHRCLILTMNGLNPSKCDFLGAKIICSVYQ